MNKENTPIMLPPAPKQTYIDVYIDKETSSSSKLGGERDKIRKEKRIQADYEAEVVIYRSLEKLREGILVLHGLEYTHHQYRLCDSTHNRRQCTICKKNTANKEAECDFVVIGRNYFVIIEVKNVPLDQDRVTEEKMEEIKGALAKSRRQGQKVNLLIRGLLEQVFGEKGEEMCRIFNFSAFPSTERHFFHNSEEKQILCKEDLADFGHWWKKNVADVSLSSDRTDAFSVKFEEVKEMLLAIWCSNRNQCDELRCSLGQSIREINEELKRGKITYSSKNRSPNSNVVDVTDHDKLRNANYFEKETNREVNIFRDILKVNNLTMEQRNAYNRDQNMLVVNGPAGSGKTIILLAKIIQLLKSNRQDRAVLFIYTEGFDSRSNFRRYQDPLKEAGISNKVLILEREKNKDTLILEILDSSDQSNRVKIVEIQSVLGNTQHQLLVKLIQTNTRLHVFADDIQVAEETYTPDYLLQSLQQRFKEPSATQYVWLTCDLTQIKSQIIGEKRKVRPEIIRDIPATCRVTLTLNLRNTRDIANILSKIREQIVRHSNVAGALDVDVVLPALTPGHYIHGPQTVVHVIEQKVNRDMESPIFVDLVTKELDKLSKSSEHYQFDIGVVHNTSYDDMYNHIAAIKKTVESRASNEKIEISNVTNCYSTEYPAVIVVYDVFNVYKTNIAPLYLLISRARVYCSVILYSYYSNLSEDQLVIDLLNELENSVKIIRHGMELSRGCDY